MTRPVGSEPSDEDETQAGRRPSHQRSPLPPLASIVLDVDTFSPVQVPCA